MGPFPLVGVVMGSVSDMVTMKAASEILVELGISHDLKAVSAHREPALMFEYAKEAASNGLEVIIAGAGGAAHLPGMMAAITSLPVLGVPIEAEILRGVDALLSIVQMPKGIPVATFSIGRTGAINAAIFAAMILASRHPELIPGVVSLREKYRKPE